MEFYKLNKVDPRDMGDVLMKIQRSFNIELDNEGLKEVHTFGHLCDLIIDKINLNQSEICSTQHAFYMLRDAIAHKAGMDKCAIKPHAKLSEIIPSDNRPEFISEIESELGYEFNLFQPRKLVTGIFAFLLAASFVGCFYNLPLGITGILISALSLKFAGKFGKEMHLKTVGDLANKVSKESYLRCKHNRCTINKNEIEQRVRELFTNELKLEPIAIRRNTHFN